jgi:hypothetical protein
MTIEYPDVKVEEFREPSKKMGWTCKELKGWEVKVPSADFDKEIMKLSDDQDKLRLIDSCENLTKLRQGKKVLVMSITGWVRGKVVIEGGQYSDSPYVESGGSIFYLEMAEDERNCFVTTSQINKACFDMVKTDAG